MNLFHLNTGVDSKVLLNADYDIRRYTDFISKSIDFLKRETLSIKVTKQIIEIEYVFVRGESAIVGILRFKCSYEYGFRFPIDLLTDSPWLVRPNKYATSSICGVVEPRRRGGVFFVSW